MWVFGYGSLMWDNWEKCFHGTKHDNARLRNYRRDFNKQSVEGWGTPKQPGPTLGLSKQKNAECIGSAFCFGDKWKRAILAYLRAREGPSFKLVKKTIEIADGVVQEAFTPINDPKRHTYIGDRSIEERVKMAKLAKGRDGNCFDYVRNIHEKLSSLGIADQSVNEMWEELERLGPSD